MDKPILKPLSIPELLDKVLQIYKQHAFLLMAVFAIILVPATIIRSISVFYFNDTRVIDLILVQCVHPFAELGMVVMISSLYLGKGATIQTSLAKGAKKYWAFIGASFLMGLAMIPALLLLFIFSLGGVVLIFIGLLVFIPVISYLFTRWSLVVPSILLEDLGATKGMERSWSLTDRYFWRVFGTTFAAKLLAALLSTLPSLFVGFFLERMVNFSPKVVLVAMSATEQLAAIISAPLTIGVFVFIYYDLRIRKEGFDLAFASEDQDS